jgi:hypothetical protein
MNDKGKEWGVIIALLTLIVTVTAVVVAITTPELRNFFGLNDGDRQPNPPVVQPAGPQEYIIGENASELVKEADTRLSAAFHDEYKTASITITPAGKQALVRPVLNGYTEEFTSSTGVFLVHVLNVDWNSRTITVQVSRKS